MSDPRACSQMPHENNLKALMRPDGKKLIARFDAPVPEFVEPDQERELLVFDYRADYWERAPISDAQLSQQLRDDFYSLYDRSRVLRREVGPLVVRQETLEDALVEQLQALGYLQ